MRINILSILFFVSIHLASATQSYEFTENFNTPQFYAEQVHFWSNDNTTKFAHSQTSGFTWGAYSPAASGVWGPIAYLYSTTASSIRNALCFTNATESAGSYAYCQFDSEEKPGMNDSLIGLVSVEVDFMLGNPSDKLGLLIRDAKGHWYYSHQQHAVIADGDPIVFAVTDFTWLKVTESISNNLNSHENISNGLGDVRTDASEGTPDLSYITGGGIILQEAVIQDKNLRIRSIKWIGKTPTEIPQIISPANNSTVNELSTILKWNYETDEAVSFNVWFAKSGKTLNKIANNIYAHSFEVNDLLDKSTYVWRVDVISGTEIKLGTEWSFDVSKEMSQYFKDVRTKRLASSDQVSWTQIGPGMAGYCEEFWCHPTDAKTMFMSPDMYNSYGSWDGGASWQTIKDFDGTGVDMRRVQSITFSRQNPDFGLAIDVRGYLYKSTNRGRKWTKIGFDSGGRHSELTVDPTNDQIWYMGAGDFWNVKSNHRTLASLNDPSKGYFYTYSKYGHIYKSTNGGQSWIKKTSGLPAKLDVGKIIIDPSNNEIVIAATNYGIYRSTNKGESWTKGGSGLPNNMPRDMDYFYDSGTKEFILYVVDQTSFNPNGKTIDSEGGIYKSDDHGQTWTSISGNLAVDFTKISDWIARDKYHNSVAFWLGISKNEAKSSYPDYPTKVYSIWNRIKVNPNNKDEIYLSHNTKHAKGFVPGDVWKTTDGGDTWKAAARTGLYWSNNKDATYWSGRNNNAKVNTKFAHLQHEMEIRNEVYGNRFLEINKNGELFICLDQQVLKSINGGASWQQIDDVETKPNSKKWVGSGDSNLPGRFMLLETGIKNRYLFCSGEHGLWQTAPLEGFEDSMAVAVEQIEGQVHEGGAHSISSVAVNPNDPNTIYTLMFRQSHRGKFRRSTDGGIKWENIGYPCVYGGNLSSDNIFQFSLTIDPVNPDNIYFCAIANPVAEVSGKLLPADYTGLGVCRSTDGGKNWAFENTGMPTGSSVRRITMDPKNPSVLYAALNEGRSGTKGGLYQTIDKGDSWTKVNIPGEIIAVNNVFVDRNTGNIFISCGRDKGTFEEGGVWKSTDDGTSWEKIFYMSYIWQTEVSPLNPDIITINAAMPHENLGASKFNPGAYLSRDGGKVWQKINTNLGQPNTITDLKPDPYREDIFWCALKGSGWAIGYSKDSERAWSQATGSGTTIEQNTLQAIVEVSPNPVRDFCKLKIDLQKRGLLLCDIYNLKGQKVKVIQFYASAGKNTLPFSTKELNPGTYLLSINASGTSYTTKFLKTN